MDMMQGGIKLGKLNSGKGKKFLIILAVLVLSLGAYVSAALPAQVPAVNDPPASRAPKMLDEQFLDVAAKAPGFGGMFIDGDVLKVYLITPAQRPAAEAAIAAVFGRDRIPPGGIQVLHGQYSFTQLKKWHGSTGTIFNIPGVIFTDVDESSNRLKVGVESPDSFGVVEQELIKQGIPRGAFVIEKAEPVVFAYTLQDKIRPIQGGIQIRFSNYLCTLGFNGVRSGTSGFVVNSHCTDKQGGVESTKYYQPYYPTTDYFIGYEIADPIYTNTKCLPGIIGKVCRWSDSAYAQVDSGVNQSLGLIARPESVDSLNIAGSFRITSENASFMGDSVNKVGRTTGWTQGNVANTCVNTYVSGTNIVQLCQDFVSAGVGSGDSGSPVFFVTNTPQPYDVQLRGILWGSSGETSFVYSPIDNIELIDELGQINTIAETTPPAISNVATDSITESSATINWTTDEPADSQVEYGTTNSYGLNTTIDTALVTSHSVTLTGLIASTTYYYMVISRDAAGNLATSADNNFTTLGADNIPPIISNVQHNSVTSTGAVITWNTNEPSDSLVRYGNTTSLSTTANSSDLVTNHSLTLTGLSPSTAYYYEVQSTDPSSNKAVNNNSGTYYNFTTAASNNMHIANIEMSITKGKSKTYATAKITIVDANNDGVSDATVSGKWSGLTFDSDTRTTDASGVASLRSDSVRNNLAGTFTFTVTDVNKPDWVYNSSANIKVNGSISMS